jgi:hypothetical protein
MSVPIAADGAAINVYEHSKADSYVDFRAAGYARDALVPSANAQPVQPI